MLRPLESQIREVEQQIGKGIVLRGIKTPDRTFRGHISSGPGYLLLEYHDETAGYFWDCDIIRELLELVRQGQRDFTLYNWDMMLAASPDNAKDEAGN